jgi:Sec-independent protein translocase protein TatA
MGFHLLDTIVIVGIALLIFGPKTLQSLSRSAGRGLSQARDVKEQLMAELPLEDLAQVKETVSQIPLSPQQAARKLMTTSLTPNEEKSRREGAEENVQKQK